VVNGLIIDPSSRQSTTQSSRFFNDQNPVPMLIQVLGRRKARNPSADDHYIPHVAFPMVVKLGELMVITLLIFMNHSGLSFLPCLYGQS
jgi:hypothetical protein